MAAETKTRFRAGRSGSFWIELSSAFVARAANLEN